MPSSTSGLGSVNAASYVIFAVVLIIAIFMAATGFVWIIAPCVFLLAILLVGTIKYRHKIRATRVRNEMAHSAGRLNLCGCLSTTSTLSLALYFELTS